MKTSWLKTSITFAIAAWLSQPTLVLAQGTGAATSAPANNIKSGLKAEQTPPMPTNADSAVVSKPAPDLTVNKAPADARLFAVPVVEAKKQAWVSVYDQSGRPLADISVLVNGVPTNTNKLGQAIFTVPNAASVTIKLAVEHDTPSSSITYGRSADGWLVSESYAAEAVDGIESTVDSNESAPVVAYAPAAIETDQSFVIVGRNLSGKPETDHIIVDGYDASIFAGSSASLLARTPKRIGIGPLRELYVTSDGENSNTLEVDVCSIDVSTMPSESGENIDKAAIRLVGTNVPSLVELRNHTPDTVALTFAGRKLGSHSSVVTPGGENNSIILTVNKTAKDSFDLDTHLVADAPWSPDDSTIFGDANLRKLMTELNRAEIIRLKRRMVAVENRIAEEQETRNKAAAENGKELSITDGSNARLRLLSNRSRRINAMLLSRRAVFQALGGTEAEYRQALEDATGNTVINLEKNLQPITSAALLAATSAEQKQAQANQSDAKATKSPQALQESLSALQQQLNQQKTHPNARLAPPPEPYIPSATGAAIGLPQLLQLNDLPPAGTGKQNKHSKRR